MDPKRKPMRFNFHWSLDRTNNLTCWHVAAQWTSKSITLKFHIYGRFFQFHGRFVQFHGRAVQIRLFGLLFHEFGQIFHEIGQIMAWVTPSFLKICWKPCSSSTLPCFSSIGWLLQCHNNCFHVGVTMDHDSTIAKSQRKLLSGISARGGGNFLFLQIILAFIYWSRWDTY